MRLFVVGQFVHVQRRQNVDCRQMGCRRVQGAGHIRLSPWQATEWRQRFEKETTAAHYSDGYHNGRPIFGRFNAKSIHTDLVSEHAEAVAHISGPSGYGDGSGVSTGFPSNVFDEPRSFGEGVVIGRNGIRWNFVSMTNEDVLIWRVILITMDFSLRFGHQAAITDIDALSRERAITSGGSDCSIRIWKLAEESQLIYNGHKGSIESVRLINDENFLSSGDDG